MIVAALVSVLLISSTLIANQFVTNISNDNSNALKLRAELNDITRKIRHSLWLAEFHLHKLITVYDKSSEKIVTTNIYDAINHFENLTVDDKKIKKVLNEKINSVKDKLIILKNEVTTLLLLRQDSNWVYPALPYINGSLLQRNVAFMNAVRLAMNDINDIEDEPYALSEYRKLDYIYDLWQRIILQFRALMIRFSGIQDVPSDAKTEQEINITDYLEVLHLKIDELQKLKNTGTLSTQTEISLVLMDQSAKEWSSEFEKITKLRLSTYWRADTEFLDTRIRPAISDVHDILQGMEDEISNWSSENISIVESAARRLSLALWGLTLLALLFVIFIYVSLKKSILNPIAMIARALSAEAKDTEYVEVVRSDAIEINQLITAFEKMRTQVNDRKKALEHQALHDSLTGLPNRALLYDRLQHGMQMAQRNKTTTSLLLLDLNRFKEINDTLGHQIGDRILQRVAMRLSEEIRESDTVARLGGDEFAIVIPDVNLQKAAIMSKKIAESIEQVFKLDGHNLYVSVSVGVAMYPDHGEDASTLVRHADIAMYHAKRTNNRISIYDENQDEYNISNLSLVGDLRNAIINNQLEMHYQPKVDIETGRPTGTEALLRWMHPSQGYITPDIMVRIAEQTGLITSLTKWVIDRTLQQYSEWGGLGSNLSLSINLSALDLQNPTLADDIYFYLGKYKVPPEALILEITESAVMSDPTHAREVLEKFHNRGIRLSIDDFGTGFSSLGYLKLLPVTELKIDKSFVMDMLTDENDSIIVKSTIDLAHNLGLMVIAEGIESMEVLNHLRTLGCDIGQGYYISKPIPLNQLISWLHEKQNSNVKAFKS